METIIRFNASNRSRNRLDRLSNCSFEDIAEEGVGGILENRGYFCQHSNEQWSYGDHHSIQHTE